MTNDLHQFTHKLLNAGLNHRGIYNKLECLELVDIITGEIINGTFSISIPAFGVRIFTANDTNTTEFDENVVIKAENKKVTLKNNAGISSGDAKKSYVLVAVIGSLCIILIIALVVGIAVYVHFDKKKNEIIEEYDDEPLLLDENNGYTNV